MTSYQPQNPIQSEADLEYLDGDYRIRVAGAFVRCAVTGKPIPLEDLRYWNVDLQEAYSSPDAKLERLRQLGRIPPAPAG